MLVRKHLFAMKWEIMIVFSCLCLSVYFFSVVCDDYGSLFMSMASGQYSNFPFIDLHYMGYICVDKIYKFLYHLLPNYNWTGIAILLFEIVGLYLMLNAIKKIVFPADANQWLVRGVHILFSLFFIENLVVLSHTRFSLLYCGISLFNLAFTRELSKKQILFNVILFIIGMLHRPESSLGMIMLVSIGYLLYRFDLKHLFRRILFPILSTVMLFTIFTIDWASTDMFVKKIEPEIEYKIMDGQVVSFSAMKTAQDSVKYEAAIAGMWFDTNVITPDFLRSLILPGINLSPSHVTGIFFHIVSFYQYYIFIPVLVAVFIFLCFFQPTYRWTMFKIVLFQLAVFLLLFALDYNGRLVAGRHFLNLQLIALLITSFYFFKCFHNNNPLLTTSSVLIVSLGAFFTLKSYKADTDLMAKNIECYEAVMNGIETSYTNKIIVTTMSNVYLLDHKFSVKNKNYKNNTYLMYDMFKYSVVPEYINYLGSMCNCNMSKPEAFFTWLSGENALYMAEAQRYNLTEKYMSLVHHKTVQFNANTVLKEVDCIANTEYWNYELRNVKVAH
jgi:hypothetical protein